MNKNALGVALDGHDVVAYFTEDRAVRGGSDLAVEHDGATFYFSSQDNRDSFRESPERYKPAFDGYCAFAVAAHKARVPSDPKTFKVYNGSLLLFFNDLHEGKPVNTKVMWNANEQQHYLDATRNWPSIE